MPLSKGTETKPQDQIKHPQEWQADLNPEHLAGQNIGGAKSRYRSAAEIKHLTRQLQQFNNDELEQIPILRKGERLQQGAVYLDLASSATEPITATGNMAAGDDHLYVPKAETPYTYWNRLVESCRAGENPSDVSNSSVSEEMVDKTLADSFPTSDPPSWTTGREPDDKT
jgi:hypothetical protein